MVNGPVLFEAQRLLERCIAELLKAFLWIARSAWELGWVSASRL